MKKTSGTANTEILLGTLKRALELEYSMIIHYPRIATAIMDAETKALVNSLGTASIRHADEVASAITRLGGKPSWSFEPLPDEDDLIKIFDVQLDKEKLAFQLHSECVGLASDLLSKSKFEEIAQEEKAHIQAVIKIISKLGSK